MTKKTLIFLCDNYPIAAREFFVDDEMRVIAPYFEKIIVLTSAEKDNAELHRYVPENMEVIQFSRANLETQKWKSIWRLLIPFVLRELFFMLKKLPLKYWLQAFKILYVEIHRASNLQCYLINTLHELQINVQDCIFYSYWHDYKAMALALMRKENSTLHCFARAHRWDVFVEENNPPYLPFKKFIIENLSKTISISDAGKKAFEQYVGQSLDGKIVVSRLGKFNDRKPLLQKINDEFVICSCSNLYFVKQVDKIIEVLSLLKIPNIHWIHFGDGEQRDELENMARQKLRNIQYEFKGEVANESILDFYAENYVDLFLNLSLSEGIPVSIMEAFSAGISVLATNVGGTSEIVNNQNGFLIDKSVNVHEVASIIETYLLSSIDNQAQKRAFVYNYWKENYEGRKNYTNFISLIENIEKCDYE